jgi:hypothetical protein
MDVVTRMRRGPLQYKAVIKQAVADGSKAQMENFVEDAKADIALLVAEVSRLRQDLNTAYERAAKWLQDEAANELDAARKAEAAGFEHIARLHYSRCGAYEIAMPAILALKTESSNG